MTTKLGGVTIADPMMSAGGLERREVDVGALHEMADGSIKYDYVSTRAAFTVRWKAITGTERNTLAARYAIKTTQSFETPNGFTVTVFVVPSSWREGFYRVGDGTWRYDIEFQLAEES